MLEKWNKEKAWSWYQEQPWLVGANYIPANAINQLEMWQRETFNPEQMEKELGWAENIGMNTMRVYLHDLLWRDDPEGFKRRIDEFLTISAKHGIKPTFVLFDSCWDPTPQSGRQREPKPGVHNSGWVQSPGMTALANSEEYARLESYVKGIVGAFAKDDRILAWDIWNEPCNLNETSYRDPQTKRDHVLHLLPLVFQWAREACPTQPLTSGVWQGDWSCEENLTPIEKIQLNCSDIISFHNYESAIEFAKRIQWLKRYELPILCTEYMARGNNSLFEDILPIAKEQGVAVYNWGLVAGKSQTHCPWNSWDNPCAGEPDPWFHDIFHSDGTPYLQKEADFIRAITSQGRSWQRTLQPVSSNSRGLII